MNKNRLEALSDGVFAIVITLLILEIKVPHVTVSELNKSLITLLPKAFSFALSFVIIGVYWVAHHNMLHFIAKVDRTSLWLNILVLFTICIIPFPTALIGDYPDAITPAILYGATLAAVNLSGTLFWTYSVKHSLMQENLNPVFARNVTYLHMSPLIIYLIAALFAFVNVQITYSIYILVPLFFILPNPLLNRLFRNPFSKQ
jgi:uncharacterized membrane protein